MVTREGMPLGYEVFAGNRTDVTTVEEIVTTMEQRYGLARRIWVMDRGMTSAENVAWLQQTGRRYLIGALHSELCRWGREIADAKDWQRLREGVEAKLCCGPDGSETFLLCRSRERRGEGPGDSCALRAAHRARAASAKWTYRACPSSAGAGHA